ncbi:MAG TPA: hypothetical protein VJU18_06735 [Vicinamibacteria bacterium]|nr:hypothetical protein [Vicinamibacteria bacterium]
MPAQRGTRMVSRAAAFLTAGVGVLVLCVPLSILFTLVLLPLWRWLERTYHIESVGHSGPAEWCFLTIYAASVAISVGAGWFTKRRWESGRGT